MYQKFWHNLLGISTWSSKGKSFCEIDLIVKLVWHQANGKDLKVLDCNALDRKLLNGIYWIQFGEKVWLKQMWSNCKSNLKLSTFLEKKEKNFFPISNRDENATSFCALLQKWKTGSERQNWLGIIKTLILFGLTLFVLRETENRPDFHQIELFAFNFFVSGFWTSFASSVIERKRVLIIGT